MPNELLTTCFECGAQIVFHAGEEIVTCEYCGMKNARPKSSGDELAAMKRGNELRANCEFEEALKCYEYVLRKFPDEHEALWGKLLCKYGVETVEERRFGKVNRYHLCHRVRRTALRNEGDYRRACELAPAAVRAQYEEIAAYVDNVQTKVREKVAGREGYEVFICYKETVPGSERSTPDSKIARELYLRYQKAGYRVFFAPYTLESKYGEDYEAEIYLALKTSSVMLVIGTKPEYMNATWPKSEWSRYLEFMPDNNGLLIPVFSGMTVKELPQEFRNLGIQGCCIEQHLNYQENIEQTLFERLRKRKAKVVQVNPKYRRALLYLESGNFEMADNFFEQVLNEEPENAAAYMGKLCVERQVRSEKELEKQETPLSDNWNYQLAVRYANEAQHSVYEGYERSIRRNIEDQKLLVRYNEAKQLMDSGEERKIRQGSKEFAKLGDYRDSGELAKQCADRADQMIYDVAARMLAGARTPEDCASASKTFERIAHYADAKEQMRRCAEKADRIVYDSAVQLLANAKTKEECERAARRFEQVAHFADAKEQIRGCAEKADWLRYEAAGKKLVSAKSSWELAEIKTEFEALAACRKKNGELAFPEAADLAQQAEAKRQGRVETELQKKVDAQEEAYEQSMSLIDKKNRRMRVVALLVVLALVMGVLVPEQIKATNYRKATEAFESGDYERAAELYGKLGYYKDSAEWANESLLYQAAGLATSDEASDVSTDSGNAIEAVDKNSSKEAIRNLQQILIRTGFLREGSADGVYGKNTANAVSEFQAWVNENYGEGTVSVTGNADRVTMGYLEGAANAGVVDQSASSDVSVFSSEIYVNKKRIAAGGYHTVGLKADGTVVASGMSEEGQCDTESWHDIETIAAGIYHTVGVKSDGTVVAVGFNGCDQCRTESWRDVVTVEAGWDHTVGIRSDGTVVATGDVTYGQCNTEAWRDIVAVGAGADHTVGLKSDGTVVAIGSNEYGQCDTESWRDIVAVSVFWDHTVGLKSDGTVVAVGDNGVSQCETEGWRDIVAVSAGVNYTVGLKSDGTVIAVGWNEDGQCNTEDWRDIVSVSAGDGHTVGLKSDGTVVAVGRNSEDQLNVSSWDLF